jgi:hypothetical protein
MIILKALLTIMMIIPFTVFGAVLYGLFQAWLIEMIEKEMESSGEERRQKGKELIEKLKNEPGNVTVLIVISLAITLDFILFIILF